jgi:Mobilization protein NikA
MKDTKTEQLQLRVSRREKEYIKRRAKRANVPVSDWVLSKLIPDPQQRFEQLLRQLHRREAASFVLASLNDFLTRLSAGELIEAVSDQPRMTLSDYLSNYVAAMIEYACCKKAVVPPGWLNEIPPLPEPAFATALKSVRLHLLRHSPPPFRRRNIFIDASIGDRV